MRRYQGAIPRGNLQPRATGGSCIVIVETGGRWFYFSGRLRHDGSGVHASLFRRSSPPCAMMRPSLPRGVRACFFVAVAPFEIIGSTTSCRRCSKCARRRADARERGGLFTVPMLFCFISDTCSKLGPAKILDQPPTSTVITAAVDSLLPACRRGCRSWPSAPLKKIWRSAGRRKPRVHRRSAKDRRQGPSASMFFGMSVQYVSQERAREGHHG